MLNKQEILQLIDQKKFNEALMIIDNLETNDDLVLEDHLTLRLLRSQVLMKTGKPKKGLELAKETLTVVRDQVPVNQLLLADAIITKTEAFLRWIGQSAQTFAIEKLSEYIQLLEQGERIIMKISNMESPATMKQAAVFQRNKGIIYGFLKEFDLAEGYLQESVALHKKVGDKKGVVETLVNLATFHKTKNESDSQIKINHKSLKLCEELGDRERIAETFLDIAHAYQSKGEPEIALTYVQRSLQLANELPRTFRVAKLLFNIGLFWHANTDEAAAALDAYQKSLGISEELDIKEGISICFHILGDLYQYSKGDLNKALEYYERSMALFEEVGDKLIHGWNLVDAGNLYHLKGDLDLALDHFQKAFPLFEEISNDFYFYQTLLHIGRVYRSKGNNNAALDYYKRCLNLLEGKKLLWGQDTEGLTYHELIEVMLDKKDINEAKKYFKRFSHYREEKAENKLYLDQWYKLSEALILKTSVRIKDKARAQQLFQEIIDDPNVKFNLMNYLADSKKTATLNLCELLLFELQSSSNEITEDSEVFQEINYLLDNLASLAQRQHSFPLLVNILILQAKFALIEGNPTDAMQLLDQAKTTADEKNLGKLGEKVSIERQLLISQLESWETLFQNDSSLKERLARIQLEEYISKALKVVHIE